MRLLDKNEYPFHKGERRTHRGVYIPPDVTFEKRTQPKLSWWQRLIKWLNSP